MEAIPYIKVDQKYFIENEYNNSLVFDDQKLYCTTQYNLDHFSNENIVYLSCIYQNNSFFSLINGYERSEKLQLLSKKMQAQYRAVSQLNVPMQKAYKFIPSSLFEEFNGEFLDAMKYVVNNVVIPSDYEHLRYALGISEYIKHHPIKHYDKIVYIKYNPFTPYGRFGLYDNSYNILSDSKESRKNIKPISDDFKLLEMDYNAFEIRVLLALCKIKQPQEDLYNILHKKQDHLSRPEFKSNLIASLYSNHPERTPLQSLISKRFLKERFPIVNNKITNIFGKTMDCEEYYYFTRLIQSTSAYIFFQQVWQMIAFLVKFGYKSQVAFCIHDSLCIQLHKDELHLIQTIKDILSSVELKSINYSDTFPMKVKLGTNYATLKDISNV